MNELHIGGLRESAPEKVARRFPLGAITPQINLNSISGVDFTVCEGHSVIDQRADDDCTGCAVATALEAHEGFPISEHWLFMKTKLKEGTIDTFGASLEDALWVPCNVGGLKKTDEPSDMLNASRKIYADWANWPDLDEKASPQAQGSYFWINKEGYPSIFDAVRAALWQYKDKKNKVVCGAYWRNSWTLSQMSEPLRGVISSDQPDNDPSYPHAFVLEGQKYINGVPYIIAHLSNGEGFGDHGHFYFPAHIINKEFKFGFAMLNDMPQNVAKKVVASNASVSWNLKLAFMWRTIYRLNELLKKLVQHQGD